MRTNKLVRVYVPVISSFDSTGFMRPQSILWKDGRVFKIDAVKDFRRAFTSDNLPADCYTVFSRGQQKFLYFERSDPRFPTLFGRWFVETRPANA